MGVPQGYAVSPERYRRFKQLTYVDGALATCMSCFGDTLTLTYLAMVRTDPVHLGLLATVPVFIGAFFQCVVPWYWGARSPKPLVLWAVALQVVGLVILASALLDPARAVAQIGLGLALYSTGGMTATGPWNQWVVSLLGEERNAFLARRAGHLSVCHILGLVVIGLVGEAFVGSRLVAYFVFAGAIFRALSFVCLAIQPESWPQVGARREEAAEAPSAEPAELRRPRLAVLCLLGFALGFVIHMAGPFFNPYQIEVLGAKPTIYLWLAAVPYVARFLMARRLGLWLDAGRFYETLGLAYFLVAMQPIVWALTSRVELTPIAQVVTGIAWGAFDIMNVLLIVRLFPGQVASRLGAYLAALALGGTFGATLSGKLVASAAVDYTTVFWLSGLLRMVFAYLVLRYLRAYDLFRFRNLYAAYRPRRPKLAPAPVLKA